MDEVTVTVDPVPEHTVLAAVAKLVTSLSTLKFAILPLGVLVVHDVAVCVTELIVTVVDPVVVSSPDGIVNEPLPLPYTTVADVYVPVFLPVNV